MHSSAPRMRPGGSLTASPRMYEPWSGSPTTPPWSTAPSATTPSNPLPSARGSPQPQLWQRVSKRVRHAERLRYRYRGPWMGKDETMSQPYATPKLDGQRVALRGRVLPDQHARASTQAARH